MDVQFSWRMIILLREMFAPVFIWTFLHLFLSDAISKTIFTVGFVFMLALQLIGCCGPLLVIDYVDISHMHRLLLLKFSRIVVI